MVCGFKFSQYFIVNQLKDLYSLFYITKCHDKKKLVISIWMKPETTPQPQYIIYLAHILTAYFKSGCNMVYAKTFTSLDTLALHADYGQETGAKTVSISTHQNTYAILSNITLSPPPTVPALPADPVPIRLDPEQPRFLQQHPLQPAGM